MWSCLSTHLCSCALMKRHSDELKSIFDGSQVSQDPETS